MDEVNTSDKYRFLHTTSDRRGYRQRLAQPRTGVRHEADDDEALDLVVAPVRRVTALAREAGRDTAVFQAVVVAALQTLNRVLDREHEAAAASISLAQGEKMQGIVRATEDMAEALTATLSEQGRKMLHLCRRPQPAQGEASWWFALSETIQALEEGMERMGALVYHQPKGAPARTLCSLVIRLMRNQHKALLAEADHWIS